MTITIAKSPTAYVGLEADTKPTANVSSGSTFWETDTDNRFTFDGDSWNQTATGGANHVYGLAKNMVRVSATLYNSTDILGFRILNKGTGSLIITPKGGAGVVTITAAELTAMGDGAYMDLPWHLESLIAGTGMELVAYIP